MTIEPKVTHAFDQLTGVARESGQVVAAYYRALKESGLTSDVSMTLARDFQMLLFNILYKPRESGAQ